MLVPIKESTRPVLIVTKATSMRLGLSNVGAITPQIGQDALYVPIAIERVTARYIDNLKFCLCDCQTALGKYFSREIDKRKRDWERTLRDNPEYRQTIERNTERLDTETGSILIVQHVVADSADSTLDRCEASPDGAIAIQ